jgi:hypothetical protein
MGEQREFIDERETTVQIVELSARVCICHILGYSLGSLSQLRAYIVSVEQACE